ncbi:hypothetical protein Tco_1386309 [Tanacetum coccineum]
MSNRHQELTSPEQTAPALASPEQTATGKDFSNPFIVGSLLKTIWVGVLEADLTKTKQTYSSAYTKLILSHSELRGRGESSDELVLWQERKILLVRSSSRIDEQMHEEQRFKLLAMQRFARQWVEEEKAKILRYHSCKLKPKSIAKKLGRNMVTYLKKPRNFKMTDFKGMSYTERKRKKFPRPNSKDGKKPSRKTTKEGDKVRRRLRRRAQGFLDVLEGQLVLTETSCTIKSLGYGTLKKYKILKWKCFKISTEWSRTTVLGSQGAITVLQLQKLENYMISVASYFVDEQWDWRSICCRKEASLSQEMLSKIVEYKIGR